MLLFVVMRNLEKVSCLGRFCNSSKKIETFSNKFNFLKKIISMLLQTFAKWAKKWRETYIFILILHLMVFYSNLAICLKVQLPFHRLLCLKRDFNYRSNEKKCSFLIKWFLQKNPKYKRHAQNLQLS